MTLLLWLLWLQLLCSGCSSKLLWLQLASASAASCCSWCSLSQYWLWGGTKNIVFMGLIHVELYFENKNIAYLLKISWTVKCIISDYVHTFFILKSCFIFWCHGPGARGSLGPGHTPWQPLGPGPWGPQYESHMKKIWNHASHFMFTLFAYLLGPVRIWCILFSYLFMTRTTKKNTRPP